MMSPELADIVPASLGHYDARQKTKSVRERFSQLLAARPVIMGVLNITPDSFFDGGDYDSVEAAVAQAKKLAAEGADIIDVGAESTRPGSTALTVEEELTRLSAHLPQLMALDLGLVSIDTYKAEIARYATAQGVGIINDVWGLQADPRMGEVVAQSDAIIVIMHNRNEVDEEIDILDDIAKFLDKSLQIAVESGIPDRNIVLDPGLGFGKSRAQDFEIVRKLQLLKTFGFPVSIGLSRKRMIGALTGKEAADRLSGTIAANTIALMNGADMVRVHDVDAHKDMLNVFQELGKL